MLFESNDFDKAGKKYMEYKYIYENCIPFIKKQIMRYLRRVKRLLILDLVELLKNKEEVLRRPRRGLDQALGKQRNFRELSELAYYSSSLGLYNIVDIDAYVYMHTHKDRQTIDKFSTQLQQRKDNAQDGLRRLWIDSKPQLLKTRIIS